MKTIPAPQFGTDGVRGLVGEQLHRQHFYHLGLCAAAVLAPTGTLAVGRDTRRSGEALQRAFCDGMMAGGAHVLDVGVMPSGILGWLCGADQRIVAGAMITASHNPEQYNGIKFYDSAGAKIDRAAERKLLSVWPGERAAVPGQRTERDGDIQPLIAALRAYAGDREPLQGLSLVIDCARGAGATVARPLCEALGARVQLIFADAGGDINANCGSEHPQQVQKAVADAGADFGISLDGDGDRLVVATASGQILGGDDLLYLHAVLQRPTGIAGTVMSNIGLEKALAEMGIAFSRSDVGEIPLHAHMLERGWQLGGEPSGHLLHLALHQSADGLINAFDLLHRLMRQSRDVSQLLSGLQHCGQYALNLPWHDAEALHNKEVQSCIARFEKELAGGRSRAIGGRLLVRMSGTEPVLRLMVESDDDELGRSVGDRLATELQSLSPSQPKEQERAAQT